MNTPTIDLNIQNVNGNTALVYAIEQKDTETAELLIKHPKIHIDFQNKNEKHKIYQHHSLDG